MSFSENIKEVKLKLERKCWQTYKNSNIGCKITSIHCESKESPYSVDIYDILFGTFVILYIAFVLLVSIYEEIVRCQDNKKEFGETPTGKLFRPFSLTRNWQRLQNICWTNPDVQNLRCMQGVRFYNMLIVINGHTIFSHLVGPVSNTLTIENMKYNSSFVILAVGRYINLTYFMFSSWLLTYYFFLALEQNNKITLANLIQMIIHRLIRLTPTLAIIIALQSTWLVHLSRGPIWDEVIGEDYRSCRKNWWSNLLYINNYVNTYVNKNRMCLPQSWYTAVDTQYYIFSIFLLWFLWNHKNKIFYVLLGILVYHVGYLFCVYYWMEWDYTGMYQPELNYHRHWLKTSIWYMTGASVSANLAGLVAGLGYGYLYYKYRNQKLFTKKYHEAIWWILIWILPLGSLFFPAFVPLRTQFLSAVYNSISRSIFILSIGLLIFGLTQGLGSVMKSVCEWSPVYILGRLTYSAYLVHIFVTHVREGIKRKPTYISAYLIIMESIGNIVITYMGALLLTLFIEMPISELQKLLLPKNQQVKPNFNEKKSS